LNESGLRGEIWTVNRKIVACLIKNGKKQIRIYSK